MCRTDISNLLLCFAQRSDEYNSQFPLPFSFGSHLLHAKCMWHQSGDPSYWAELGWTGMDWASAAANTLSLAGSWRLNLKYALLLYGSGPFTHWKVAFDVFFQQLVQRCPGCSGGELSAVFLWGCFVIEYTCSAEPLLRHRQNRFWKQNYKGIRKKKPLWTKRPNFWHLPLNAMLLSVLLHCSSCRWTDSSGMGSCKTRCKQRSHKPIHKCKDKKI